MVQPIRRGRQGGLSEREQRLRDRVNQSRENVGKLGSGKQSVLDTSAYTVKWYKAIAGKKKNLMDIVPYLISEPWYPKLKGRAGTYTGLQPGDPDYKLEVPVHRRVGPENKSFLCLREAFGKACPVCEERFKLFDMPKEQQDKEAIRALNTSWRCFYNVWDYNSEEAEPTFKLFESSYKMFEEMLLKESEPEDEQLEPIFFSSLSEGKTIEWKGMEKEIGKGKSVVKFIEAVDFNFLDRDPYGEDVYGQVLPLDKMLIIPTYDQVRAALFGMEEEETAVVEEAVEEAEAEVELEQTRTRVMRRTPVQPQQRMQRQPVRQAPVTKCPEGFTFGEDHGEFAECQQCIDEAYQACLATKSAPPQRQATERVRPRRPF